MRYSYAEHTFISGGVQREITRTYYDRARYSHILKDFRQEHLRPRVATATYQDKAGETYDRATHYSYDIHGNVKSLVQEVKAHGTGLKKRVDYEYDLVSGKVNYVYYQRGEADQFIHRYEYDGDNRLVRVYTSRNGHVWEEDASYEYYGHGPLARTTLGEQKAEVQNYVYTLQGWIKGVNGHAFSYALGYYESDYQSIGTSSYLATPVAGNLYNGNIATMATHTPALGTKNPAQAWQTQQFVYDQLNRIKESRTTGGHENAYRTGYSYDANGNIVSLSRFDGSGTKQFDQLAYRYENKQSGYGRNTNKLRWVDDGTSVTEDFEDIRDQDIDNYEYDAIGNLVRDEQEEIDRIEWTVYGKVKAVHRKAGSEKPYLEFGYDAGGNRISKLSRDKDGHEKVTLYVRDASGNVMAIYEKTPERALAVTEHHVYGSSRLGIARTTHPTDLAMLHSGRVLGLKDFELSDHLGNVSVVVSDVRNSVGLTNTLSAFSYYAFGMLQPGRTINLSGARYLYNGKEYDSEGMGGGKGTYDYGFRIYNSGLARFLSVDPLALDYPFYTPYQFAGNKPIMFIDRDGLEEDLPWYLTQNKHGGKPVLTLGLPELSLVSRATYDDELITTYPVVFSYNTLVSIYNNFANSWNEGRSGRDGYSVLLASHDEIGHFLETAKLEDYKRLASDIQTYENLAGGVVLAYAGKALSQTKVVNGKISGPQGEKFRLNLGGEGEMPGFVDVNPMQGNKFDIDAIKKKNPTGGFVLSGAENLPFATGSVKEVAANNFPGMVFGKKGKEIANEIVRVLEKGGTAKIHTHSGKIPDAFKEAGFKVSPDGKTATYVKE